MLNSLKCIIFTSLLVSQVLSTTGKFASSSEENDLLVSEREYEALVNTAQRGLLAQLLLQRISKSDIEEESEPILKNKRFNRYQTGSTRSRAKLLQEIREKIHGERRG